MLKRGSGSVVPSLAELEAEYWADPGVVARGQVELRLCDASARAPIAVLRFAGTLRPGLPTFALTADEHVLGRNELATARKRISHRHFSVRVAPDGGADGRGGHVVEDLSQNGTWLDGTRLMPGAPQPLRDGALITLARASADAEHAFTYHVVENPRSTEAAAIAGSARKSHRRLLKLERPSRSSSSSSGASPRAGAPSTPATVKTPGSPSTTTGGSSNWLGGFFRSWPRTATEAEAEAEAMAAINIQRVRRGEVGRRLSKAVRAGEPITSLASAASLASSAASSSEALPPASSAWPDAFVEESETLRGDEPSPAKAAAAPAPAAAELSREELEREVRARFPPRPPPLAARPPALSPSRHPPLAQLASLRRSENLLAARLGEAEGRASQLVAANAMLKKQIEVWKTRSSSVTTANAAAQQWGHRGSVRGVSPVTAPAAAPAGTDPAATARASWAKGRSKSRLLGRVASSTLGESSTPRAAAADRRPKTLDAALMGTSQDDLSNSIKNRAAAAEAAYKAEVAAEAAAAKKQAEGAGATIVEEERV